MTNLNKKLVTVIVCTYNRVSMLKPCLESLLNQSFNLNKYEIIVVNDGSTDKTSSVLLKYPVKVISHTKNLGIPQSRNAGLKLATGEIIAFIDDDCVADKNWLDNLFNSYNNRKIVAVGGITKALSQITILEKYMSETGYGNPAPIEFGMNNDPLFRFMIYIRHMINPFLGKKGVFEVQEIYTLNSSYRKNVLQKIGSFDKNLYSFEDVDICTRIHESYKNGVIMLNSNAIIYHRHKKNVIKYLVEILRRSENTIKYYVKMNKIPPIFPFPLIIILWSCVLGLIDYRLGILTFIMLPQILYPWWFIKIIKKKDLKLSLFAYIQFLQEFFTIMGMISGFIKLKLVNYDH